MAQRDKQETGNKIDLSSPQVSVSYTYNSKQAHDGYFGPLKPYAPQAPEKYKGRIFDYQHGFNLKQRPRESEAITFQHLRAFADGYDLLRLVIETRKDQIARLDWNFVPRDKVKKPTNAQNERAAELKKFFIRPDGKRFWGDWIRTILEDLFVLDAPSVYCKKSYGGELLGLVPIDGATIKRIIDEDGNTPEPPDVAFQQYLKGIPAFDYTTEELIYNPRNVRTHKAYGYGPVEQIIMTINIAMRRQTWQLQSFTEGNIPEALIGVPEDWTPDQIRNFQEWFDNVLEGNTAQRSRAKFVPGGIAKGYQPTKTGDLFGEAEEWLARVICFAFSVSPQPFLKMMNRATAETAQETAVSEGIEPIKDWIKSFVDSVLLDHLGDDEFELGWQDEDELDPNIKSQILDRETGNGLRTLNQARVEMGEDPYPDAEFDRPMVKTANGYVPIVLTDEEKAAKKEMANAIAGANSENTEENDDENSDEKDNNRDGDNSDIDSDAVGVPDGGNSGLEKSDGVGLCDHRHGDLEKSEINNHLIKAARKYVDPEREEMTPFRERFEKHLKKLFKKLGFSVAKQVERDLNRLFKADISDEDLNDIINALEIELFTSSDDEITEILTEVNSFSAIQALANIGAEDDELVNQVNEAAVEWAKNNVADLVDDSTREMVRATIVDGMKNNKSAESIAESIVISHAFSDDRADLIAKTEIANANSAGAHKGYQVAKDVGVKLGKSWLRRGDACSICVGNADAGVIELDESFPSGHMHPTAHPRCRCVLVPEVFDEEVLERIDFVKDCDGEIIAIEKTRKR